jgi:hypothetical protein
VVVDTTGRARVIELAYELTHADGKTILVGVPRKGDNISIYSLPLHFRKVLTGSHGGSAEPHVDIPRYVRLMRAGKMTLDGLVTHEFPLDRVNEATPRCGAASRACRAEDGLTWLTNSSLYQATSRCGTKVQQLGFARTRGTPTRSVWASSCAHVVAKMLSGKTRPRSRVGDGGRAASCQGRDAGRHRLRSGVHRDAVDAGSAVAFECASTT